MLYLRPAEAETKFHAELMLRRYFLADLRHCRNLADQCQRLLWQENSSRVMKQARCLSPGRACNEDYSTSSNTVWRMQSPVPVEPVASGTWGEKYMYFLGVMMQPRHPGGRNQGAGCVHFLNKTKFLQNSNKKQTTDRNAARKCCTDADKIRLLRKRALQVECNRSCIFLASSASPTRRYKRQILVRNPRVCRVRTPTMVEVFVQQKLHGEARQLLFYVKINPS